MLRDKIFLMSLCITHACFSMDYNEMLSTSAQPIHDFLTVNVDKNSETVNEQALSDFVTSFKNLNTSPSVLCNLPDQRAYKNYTYTCPVNEQYQIEYYDANAQKHNDNVMGGAAHTVNGRPIAVHITKNGKKRTITLSDPAALLSNKRAYNLIKLLFDCNRVNEAQRIISATEKPFGLSFENIVPSFQAVRERLIETKDRTTKDALTALEQRFVKEDKKYKKAFEDQFCDCCMTSLQWVCLFSSGALMIKGVDRADARAGKVMLAAAAGMQAVKKREWIGEKLAGLRMKKD